METVWGFAFQDVNTLLLAGFFAAARSFGINLYG